MEINTLSRRNLARSELDCDVRIVPQSRELEEPGIDAVHSSGRQHAYSGSMHISSRSNLIPWAFLGLAKAWRGARLGAGRTGMSAHTVWRVRG